MQMLFFWVLSTTVRFQTLGVTGIAETAQVRPCHAISTTSLGMMESAAISLKIRQHAHVLHRLEVCKA